MGLVGIADGTPHRFQQKCPFGLAEIFEGEMTQEDLRKSDNLESFFDPNAPDMVDVYVGTPLPKPWAIILGAIVWLISIVLLFHRAVQSRRKPEMETVKPPTAS